MGQKKKECCRNSLRYISRSQTSFSDTLFFFFFFFLLKEEVPHFLDLGSLCFSFSFLLFGALKELMKCVASNKQEKQRTYLENVESLSFTKKKKVITIVFPSAHALKNQATLSVVNSTHLDQEPRKKQWVIWDFY